LNNKGEQDFIPQTDLALNDTYLPLILKIRQFPLLSASVITHGRRTGTQVIKESKKWNEG
jgi:hypothetical protein